jgi:type IV secretion system protein VirB6
LAFLAGAVQITVTDIVIRVLKVGVIVALFSETSWSFFNDNLFKVFVSGSDYLLTTVVGVTSTVGNVFGFIDPIFDKYGNGDIWALLAIQLLQIHNGLAFFACLAIYSMLIYLRAVLEVIITYCLAFLGLAVMISLAPFFIILILFEQTKSLFDNWLSTLFSYMLQPTVLLVFFLLIDQLMGEYITEVVVKACWGILIPLKISIDLHNIGIPISFSFSLPFLSGIPFYIPVVSDMNSIDDFFNAKGTFVRVATSGFIFFIYCKLSAGLINYITLITNSLTGVTPARQEGELQDVKSANPVHNIMGDIKKATSPVTSVPRKVASFAKEKFIDQKITHREKDKVGDPDYSGIKKNSSNGDSEGDIDGNSPKSEISGGKKPEKENE